MMTYLIEFLILHTLFFLIYKIFLERETQLKFLRFFLIGSTLLALTLPLIEIQVGQDTPALNLGEAGEIITHSIVNEDGRKASMEFPWLVVIPGAISLFFLLRVFQNIIWIIRCYRHSRPDTLCSHPVRKVEGLENSFTFMRWIFIDPSHFENPEEIIQHEKGHSLLLHSIDILFFNILAIVFWWTPGVWLMLRELKKVHEFEADQYALEKTDQNHYIKTLVHSTLKAHGLNLASSFDDATIVQRLNFIKKMKRKINPLKTGSIVAIVFISGAIFACEEEAESVEPAELSKNEKHDGGYFELHPLSTIERLRIEEKKAQSGGTFKFEPADVHTDEKFEHVLLELKAKFPDKEFSVVELIRENPDETMNLEKYDSKDVEYVEVRKDKSLETVKLIVREN